MTRNLIKIIIYFIVYVALQVLIMDNIYLFRIVTPFLYLYVIVKIPVNVSRSQVIAISFLLGLVIDIFSNTLGMHAAACSLAGLFRNPLMYSLSNKELTEGDTPSFKTLGVGAFMKYAISLVFLHHVALFLIESISLFDPVFLLLRIFSCVILTMLFIIIVEAFHIERKKK
jgi:rod shape-determining protein MreD